MLHFQKVHFHTEAGRGPGCTQEHPSPGGSRCRPILQAPCTLPDSGRWGQLNTPELSLLGCECDAGRGLVLVIFKTQVIAKVITKASAGVPEAEFAGWEG